MSETTASLATPSVSPATLQPPPGKQVAISAVGTVQQALEVSTIIGVAPVTFVFNENSNTPGRLLEQTVVVNRPDPNSGFFIMLAGISGAFTTSDFQFLTERPLGQFLAQVFLRGTDNLVCQVRLTDSNSDDPVSLFVTAVIVFFT